MQIRRTTPESLTTMTTTMTTTVDVTATGARAAANDAAANTRTSRKTTPQTPENRRTTPEDHRTVAARAQKASDRNDSADRVNDARKGRTTTQPVLSWKTTRGGLKVEMRTTMVVDVAVVVAVAAADLRVVGFGVDFSEEVMDKHCPRYTDLTCDLLHR